MPGMNKYDTKERRLQRRKNHIVKDLHSLKYHQRIIEDKKYGREFDDDFEFDDKDGENV